MGERTKTDMETWKTVKQYSNYSVSSLGHVRHKRGNVLTPNLTVKYPRICFHKDGRGKKFLVHRLVAEHYIENPQGLPEVNHKNGIKTDNRVENLEWVSRRQNMRHAVLSGLCDERGEKSRLAKTDWKSVKDMRLLHSESKLSTRKLGKMFGLNKSTVWCIITNKTWVI